MEQATMDKLVQPQSYLRSHRGSPAELSSAMSLEQTVLETNWRSIQNEVKKIETQRAFIKRERQNLYLRKALLDSDRARMRATRQKGWLHPQVLEAQKARRIILEVGGKAFEMTARIACRDSRSLLAALARDDSPLDPGSGRLVVDRDWWLFRHILNFLRDGQLPQDNGVLRQLYKESDFWRLDSLKSAIEKRKLKLYSSVHPPLQAWPDSNKSWGMESTNSATRVSHFSPGLSSDKLNVQSSKANPQEQEWWVSPPDWWGSREPKVEQKPSQKKDKEDWWTGSTYKGKKYDLKEDKQAAEWVASTWGSEQRAAACRHHH